MATNGIYGSVVTGPTAVAPGVETSGLYGQTGSFGGTYFEWFIFQVSPTAPATPTGGSWNFVTNTGTPPAGWSGTPPATTTSQVWVSIALINSKTSNTPTWSTPGVMGNYSLVSVGSTTTGAAGTNATVVNSGSGTNVVLDFTIPRGAPGAAGASATVAVGTTTTGAAGTSASVTNSGTASNAILNFTIPRGDTGAAGAPGQGVPTGGTTGQVLTKASGSNYDTTWTSITANIAISNDTSTATALYPLFVNTTSGTATNVYTSNAKYLYTPSTGELKAPTMNATDGIFMRAQNITTDITIAAGDNGLSFGTTNIASGVTVTISPGSEWVVV